MDSSSDTDATFSDIPEEIIVSNIFSLLNGKERQKIRAVSSTWLNIVDNFFGAELHINNANWDRLKESKNVRYAKFSNWIRDFCNNSMAHGLTVLEIASPSITLTYYNTLPLLQACTNLETLIIGNLAAADVQGMTDVNLNDWTQSGSAWFPNLKMFKFVDNWPTRSASFRNYAKGCCQQKTEFLAFLLQSMECTQLTKIDIRLNASFWWVPLGVIFKQQFQQPGPISLFDLPTEKSLYGSKLRLPMHSLGQRLNHLDQITLAYEQSIVEIKFHEHLVHDGMRQIKTFSKYFCNESKTPLFDNPVETYALVWREVLEFQSNLKEFTYEMRSFNESEFNKVKRILAHNKLTLQKVNLLVQNNQKVNGHLPEAMWDADIVNSCKDLKTLSLLCINTRRLCGYYCDDEYDFGVVPLNSPALSPVLTHMTSLPECLTTFIIQGMLGTNTVNIFDCFERFVELRRLELITENAWFQTKQGPIYTITVRELKALLNALPNIQRLTLRWPSFPEDQDSRKLPSPSVTLNTIKLLQNGIFDCTMADDCQTYNSLILNAKKCRKLLLKIA